MKLNTQKSKLLKSPGRFQILILKIDSAFNSFRELFYAPPAHCIMSVCEFAKASARRLRHERVKK
jgi:hypothetical protein